MIINNSNATLRSMTTIVDRANTGTRLNAFVKNNKDLPKYITRQHGFYKAVIANTNLCTTSNLQDCYDTVVEAIRLAYGEIKAIEYMVYYPLQNTEATDMTTDIFQAIFNLDDEARTEMLTKLGDKTIVAYARFHKAQTIVQARLTATMEAEDLIERFTSDSYKSEQL